MTVVILLLMVACAGGVGPTDQPTARGAHIDLGENWQPLDAKFSPDGGTLAFLGIEDDAMFRLATVVEGRAVALTERAFVATDFAWMPDSTELLVAGYRGDHEALQSGPTILRRVRLDGGVVEVGTDRPLWLEGGGLTVDALGTTAVGVDALGDKRESSALVQIDLSTGSVQGVPDSSPLVGSPLFHAGELYYIQADPHDRSAVLVRRTAAGQIVPVSRAGELVVRVSISDAGLFAFFFQGTQGKPNRIVLSDLTRSNDQEMTLGDVLNPELRPDGKALIVLEPGSPARPGGIVMVPLG